ncbi:MAG TPA: zf-HC2 domain-containing protein, partial [Blastocatellia bacterium]|nr:zf-HC2 domain-containing protein [Blastocatellia bacterium]
MKCELVEKLIPLHIGGDLEPSESESLRQHLADCARCRQLQEEFEASRVWLREMTAPDFDAAIYADLRATVIRQIKQQEKR